MKYSKNFNLSAKSDGYYMQTRSDMIDYVPKTASKILDVGCGAGLFGYQLKQNSKTQIEVWGVEIDNNAATLAQNKIDKVLIGDICRLWKDLPDGYFDCIIFNDVLEHLVDPFNVLLKIKAKLAEQGLVVCSIPNVRYIRILKDLVIKKQWRYQEWGILDKTHLRFFTQKSIMDMFRVLGYKILKMEGLGKPKSNWEFRLLKFFAFGYLSDTEYVKFVCIVKPQK